ncbi:MAG: hypothetical protein RL095_2573 [Verrucomicrobiota bacterium]|jgi:ABC-2 type transport system permease protein
MSQTRVIAALFRRQVGAFFTSPAAYVFTTLFTVACALAQFWGDGRFFLDNIADLAPLNRAMPMLLLFFVPVLTMHAWAEEKRQGTEEYLLTLPARDGDVVLGKYLGLLATLGVALLCAALILPVLGFVGSPDPGLIFASFLGYFLLGAAMIAAGLVASILSSNATVAFILGVAINGALLSTGYLANAAGSTTALAAFLDRSGFGRDSGLTPLFQEVSSGVLSLKALLGFLGCAALMLYVARILLARRHWAKGNAASAGLGLHYALRVALLFLTLAAFGAVLRKFPARLDLSSEKIHSLSPVTRGLLGDLKRPVLVEAFVSPKVPGMVAPVREQLLSTLREMQALSQGKVQVRIVETEVNTAAAKEAKDRFGIEARQIRDASSGAVNVTPVFLGLAVSSGAQQRVIPFIGPALPLEYELAHSIRTASAIERKKLGLLRTEANIRGGMNYQTFQSSPAWQMATELEKQYQVLEVDPAAPYPADLEVLLVVQPSSLGQAELDRLASHILGGGRSLLLQDPLSLLQMRLSPFMADMPDPRGQPPAPKGDIEAFFRKIGISAHKDLVAGNTWNPHPQTKGLAPEFVFLGHGEDFNSFAATPKITSGLQEAVFIYPGSLKAAEGSKLKFEPLLQAGGGVTTLTPCGELMEGAMFGQPRMKQPGEPVRRAATSEPPCLAARLSGPGDQGKAVDCVVVADFDFITDEIFQLRAQSKELDFDNFAFFFNAIDALAGDESFLDLRKKRPQQRHLAWFEARRKDQDKALDAIRIESEGETLKALAEAQKQLDDAVAAVSTRKDLKDEEKQMQLEQTQAYQQRLLEMRRVDIEMAASARIEKARADVETVMEERRNAVRIAAAALPPLLPVLIGLIILISRRRRESSGAPANRLRGVN